MKARQIGSKRLSRSERNMTPVIDRRTGSAKSRYADFCLAQTGDGTVSAIRLL